MSDVHSEVQTMAGLLFRGGELTFRRDIPRPTPGPGEALVAVTLAGICNTDLEITQGYMGYEGVPGHEFVGVVVQCEDPEWIGRRVCGEINVACHQCANCRANRPGHCTNRTVLGILNHSGAFAQYLVLPVENLHSVPDEVSDEQAVFTEPLAACFQILEQVQVRPTDRVLVLGEGKLGQLAAQVLHLTGCRLLVVGKNPEKLALVETLGIATMSLASIQAEPPAEKMDVVVECSGSANGLPLAAGLVRPRGTIVLKSTVATGTALNLSPLVVDEITIVGSRCGPFAPALRALASQRVRVESLISARYSLSEGVAAFERAASSGVLKVLLQVTRS